MECGTPRFEGTIASVEPVTAASLAPPPELTEAAEAEEEEENEEEEEDEDEDEEEEEEEEEDEEEEEEEEDKTEEAFKSEDNGSKEAEE